MSHEQEALIICKNKMKMGIRDPVIDGIKGIYKTARKNCQNRETPEMVLMEFQTLLRSTVTWNANIVDEATRNITNRVSRFEELMSSIFVGEAKVLSNLNISGGDAPKIQIKIPLKTRFVHKIYEKVAEKIFYQPELFDHRDETLTKRKYRESTLTTFVSEAVDETVLELAPIEGILDIIMKKEFVEPDDDDDRDRRDREDTESESDRDERVEFPDLDKVISEDKINPFTPPEEAEEKFRSISVSSDEVWQGPKGISSDEVSRSGSRSYSFSGRDVPPVYDDSDSDSVHEPKSIHDDDDDRESSRSLHDDDDRESSRHDDDDHKLPWEKADYNFNQNDYK